MTFLKLLIFFVWLSIMITILLSSCGQSIAPPSNCNKGGHQISYVEYWQKKRAKKQRDAARKLKKQSSVPTSCWGHILTVK